MPSYLEHTLLKPQVIEKRLFQLDLAANALQSSTLIVVPTGLGKTVIALIVLLARIDRGKALFLAPTRPLVEQHASFIRKALTDEEMVAFVTGETPSERRAEVWDRSRIIVSTPQSTENDLLSRRIDLKEVSLIIFDEAHRAVGNYAYVYIAERYSREARDPLVLGITASPGSQSNKIEEICANLGIEKIQIRTETDPDVRPFVFQREIEWIKVQVPEGLQRVKMSIEAVLKDRTNDFNRLGIIPTKIEAKTSKKELLDLQALLRSNAAQQPNATLFKGVSVLAEIFKLHHAIELAETQSGNSLTKYLLRLESEASSRSGSKAARRIMGDTRIKEAAESLKNLDIDHPKLAVTHKIIKQQLNEKPNSRIMVFTNFRDTASALLKFLESDHEIRASRFVGQSNRQDDKGLSQKKQATILKKFRNGEYNVIIATSVGEEGIDVPSNDLVLFYEPVPSEIRSIQRKGRTGRARAGKVVVLMARGTRDEAYYWISDRKEKTMQKRIRDLSGQAETIRYPIEQSKTARQIEITEIGQAVEEERDKVFVDLREREMGKLLEAEGLEVTLKRLEVADYIISDRIAIERKTAQDFVDSIIDPDRNLFGQISDLARTYERPLLILEGRDLFTRQVNPNSIRGAMASIAVDYSVPIIPTENQEDTVRLIAILAAREHKEGRIPKIHGHKTARTLKEQQEYLISAIPSVGPTVARNLLKYFETIENIMTASKDELEKVELVGPKIAERIRELVGESYKG
ncbi:MAG: DEAD/DEAH box helicase [Methanotrichaceae archaeon]|nr:DEAD/DEAH box helicase [Methanotrichaceae archaeon]